MRPGYTWTIVSRGRGALGPQKGPGGERPPVGRVHRLRLVQKGGPPERLGISAFFFAHHVTHNTALTTGGKP